MAMGQNLRYFFSRVPYHLFKRLLRVTGGLRGFDPQPYHPFGLLLLVCLLGHHLGCFRPPSNAGFATALRWESLVGTVIGS